MHLGIVTIPASPAAGNEYDRCMLDNAPAIQRAITNDALDVIMLSCIRLNEEPIDDEIAKITISSIVYGGVTPYSGLGLIAEIYNGSSYDITGIAFAITDKKIKQSRTYGFNQFLRYYRGIGMVTGLPAPQDRRFIKSLTHGEYIFPLEFQCVPQQEFFSRYEVAYFTARGIAASPFARGERRAPPGGPGARCTAESGRLHREV
jgi:hypothetical protein